MDDAKSSSFAELEKKKAELEKKLATSEKEAPE